MTTVAELIDALSTLPHDAPVFLSIDAEGNGFHKLDETELVDGEQDNAQRGFLRYDLGIESNVAVVLWPQH